MYRFNPTHVLQTSAFKGGTKKEPFQIGKALFLNF